MTNSLLRLQDLHVHEPLKFSKLWESSSLAAVARAVAAQTASCPAPQPSKQLDQSGPAGRDKQPIGFSDQSISSRKLNAVAKRTEPIAGRPAVTDLVDPVSPLSFAAPHRAQTLGNNVLSGAGQQQRMHAAIEQSQGGGEQLLQPSIQHLHSQQYGSLALPQHQLNTPKDTDEGSQDHRTDIDALFELHGVTLQQAAASAAASAACSSVAAPRHDEGDHSKEQQAPTGNSTVQQELTAVRFIEAFSHQFGQLPLSDSRSHQQNSAALLELFVEAAAAGITVHDVR